MAYDFHPEAKLEFQEAAQHYKKIDKKLGKDFAELIIDSLERITKDPERWSYFFEDIRRCIITKRFPYSILCGVIDDVVYIVAVMRHSRDPDYWKHRVDDLPHMR